LLTAGNHSEELSEKLQEILKDLEAEVPEIEASSVVSAEGFPIASALPVNVDETRVAAITAVVLNMSERAIMDFEKGVLDQVIIRGSEGLLISTAVGRDAVLTVSASHDARLGVILLYMERAVKKIVEILSKN
jgi:predicted regulator of Ras-like GTPase activity (Roadblock/LC7/MglB family)